MLPPTIGAQRWITGTREWSSHGTATDADADRGHHAPSGSAPGGLDGTDVLDHGRAPGCGRQGTVHSLGSTRRAPDRGHVRYHRVARASEAQRPSGTEQLTM